MPLYRKPHDAQIIYKVDTQDAALINIVKNAEMVTIQPQRFDLQKLINGEVMSVSVDVYTGHFERDGSLKQKNIEITFKQQVYLRMLENLSPASLQKEYDRIALSNGKSLLVNKIQSAPSFDHIVMLSDTNSCIKRIVTKKLVPNENDLLKKLSLCGSLKRIYFETQDFVVREH